MNETKRPASKVKVLVLWNHEHEPEEASEIAEPASVPAADDAPAPERVPDGEGEGELPPADAPAAGPPADVAALVDVPDAPAAARDDEDEDEGGGDHEAIEEDDEAAADEGEPPLVEPEDETMEAQALAVERSLSEHGLAVATVDIDDDIDRIIDAIVLEKPSIIYNLVDHFYGDNTQHAAVTALFDLFGIPYTGSEPLALANCQDRARTRLVLEDAQVPVPGYAIVRDVNAIPDTDDLEFPLIVTQAFDDIYDDEGAERPLYSREELEQRLYALSREFELPLLVEEFTGGRRLHAIAFGGRTIDVLPLCETDPGEDDEPEVVLAQTGADTADRVRWLARRAFRAAGCRDVAQIDFHLVGDTDPVVTDVRPVVDLGAGSPFALATYASHRGYAGTVHEIARQALRRARVLEDDGADAAPTSRAGASATGPTAAPDAAATVADPTEPPADPGEPKPSEP